MLDTKEKVRSMPQVDRYMTAQAPGCTLMMVGQVHIKVVHAIYLWHFVIENGLTCM